MAKKTRPRGIKGPRKTLPPEVNDPPPDLEWARQQGYKPLSGKEAVEHIRRSRIGEDERSARAIKAAATRRRNRELADPEERRRILIQATEDEIKFLGFLGRGNRAKGFRIAVRIAKQYFLTPADIEENEMLDTIKELRGELKKRARTIRDLVR